MSWTGAALATAAFIWHVSLMTSATNDNFLHMTLAQQWLAGDVPVRDFFDHAWVLQYSLSAIFEVLAGGRLIGEALVVGLAWGVSTYLVFVLVHRTTGSSIVAAASAVLLIVAGARGYSYPKGIVYAVTAILWWRTARVATVRGLSAFAAWAAIAFYWRPDHGLYVAGALAIAVLVAHGPSRAFVTRTSFAAAVMLALVAPFLVYVQFATGLWQYAQTALVLAQAEHLSHGTHQWPLLRFGRGVVAIEPRTDYAPLVTLRWSLASSPADRQQVLERYALTPAGSIDEPAIRVKLSEQAIGDIRRLINEAMVEDTAGIDRSTGTLLPSAWPASDRRRFDHAWLRVRLLPALDEQARATEIAVALFHLLPIALACASPWIARRLPGGVLPGQLVGFAAFALLIDLAMLRAPFPARMADAVVLSSIVLAFCVAALWRHGAAPTRSSTVVRRCAAALLVLVVVTTVAEAGQFTTRLERLLGGGSLPRASAAWRDVSAELTAAPPLVHYVGRPARFSLRMAAYVRECVPEVDRLLVLWFEPEIYYYSGRLMAQRHVAFSPAFANLEHEQRMTLEKVQRFAPPLVLARRSSFENDARASFPRLVDYVEAEYHRAAVVEDGGEEYWILARRDRPPVRRFGEGWPCYAANASPWSDVGVPRG